MVQRFLIHSEWVIIFLPFVVIMSLLDLFGKGIKRWGSNSSLRWQSLRINDVHVMSGTCVPPLTRTPVPTEDTQSFLIITLFFFFFWHVLSVSVNPQLGEFYIPFNYIRFVVYQCLDPYTYSGFSLYIISIISSARKTLVSANKGRPACEEQN